MFCGELISEIRHHVISFGRSFSDTAEVSFICEHPDAVRPGAVFVCVRGERADGHDGIPRAAATGVSLIVLDRAECCDACPVPWVLVRDTRAVLLPLYLMSAGHPERKLRFLAVTGTNGKTSVTCLAEAVFSVRERCAVLGTIENRIAGTAYPADMTTPPPAFLADFLKKAADSGVSRVLLEASSHALAQKRLSGLSFDCGVFTNLTEDHLDYHKTREAYYLAKRSLFSACSAGAVNLDDSSGARLLADPEFSGRLHGFSVGGRAEFTVSDVRAIPSGYDFLFSTPDGTVPVRLPLSGDFMVSNAAAALTGALLCGVPLPDAAEALSHCRGIPGRMEKIVSEPFSVYLDYAHTPDALYRALSSLKKERDAVHGGRILLLFGCGGDREREKRPKMGRIAAESADFFIITDDNPRNEDPDAIRREILSGIRESEKDRCLEIPGRENAVRTLLSYARPGDLVLLAGKGHENYAIDHTGKHPFSERDIVRDALSAVKNERTVLSDENTV